MSSLPASFQSSQRKPLETYDSFMSDATVISDSIDKSAVKNAGSLPAGAMAPMPALAYHPGNHQGRNSAPERDSVDSPPSPPATPSQQLLGADLNTNVQFAEYRDEKIARVHLDDGNDGFNDKKWVPIPLRPAFWIPFVAIMALGAVGLEIALHFSNKNQGWPSDGEIGQESSVLHYVYTLPPVAVAAILVAMWTWTDIEIKKMQPYVDLVHGDSPPHRSLLLDYTRSNNFVVWTRAASNKHYLVALASLMVLLSLSFQPLAAALLVVRDTWRQEPDVTMNSLAAIGLNQNAQFSDLTSFLTAAGYASASVLYNLDSPPFINGPYTVAPFELPLDVARNGTVSANTTAVKSETGCQPVPVQMLQLPSDLGWNNSVSFNGCSIDWQVDKNTSTLFGTDTPDCGPQGQLPQFGPVIFWFFTYLTTPPRASATFCYPSISLWDVNVSVDLASSNLTHVTELRPFSASSNFSEFSANISSLNGQAYNGINFNLTNADRFTIARRNATQLQLPASVYEAAVLSPEGLEASFEADRFVGLSNGVYSMYLSLVAREVYFLKTTDRITLQVKTFRKRVWLSDTAVHLLAVAMLLLAFFGTIVHIFHRFDRRHLHLQHEPGTIASAVSIGAQTGVGNVLAGRRGIRDINQALQDKKFRIDPQTMKIVMEGEDGYETAASPMERRRSVFAALQKSNRRSSKKVSPPGTPSGSPGRSPPRTPTTSTRPGQNSIA